MNLLGQQVDQSAREGLEIETLVESLVEKQHCTLDGTEYYALHLMLKEWMQDTSAGVWMIGPTAVHRIVDSGFEASEILVWAFEILVWVSEILI